VQAYTVQIGAALEKYTLNQVSALLGTSKNLLFLEVPL
jgi:hypothetical protein